MRGVRISYLIEHPEYIPQLAQWLFKEWDSILGERTPDARIKKLQAHLNRDKLPIAWVAHANGELLGTAALRVHDLEGREDLTPWLGGVFVGSQFRRQGIGAALCATVEDQARSQGIETLYLFTLDKQTWYSRLGWSLFAPCVWHQRPGNIMCKRLQKHQPPMEATQQPKAAPTTGQNIDPTSGSDQVGPVWGYHFVPNQAARSITSEEAVQFLTAPGPGLPDEFIWLHFSLSNPASEPWLRQYLTLPDTFYESLHSDVDATHLEQDGDTLVARIHDVLFDFTFDAPVATTSLCIKPRVVVSAHLRPWRSINQIRAEVQAGQVFRSPIEILARLFRDQASVLVDIVRRATKRVDPMEERLLAKRISVSRSELGALRRMLVRLQRLLAPEPAAFFRLLNRPPAWIAEDELQNLQQAAEKFSTAISDTSALVERVKQLQEELAALVDAQTSRTLFVLTLVTVLALPINLVAGLFGMNVGGIPLAQHPYGFFLVVSPLLVLTAFLAYWGLAKHRD